MSIRTHKLLLWLLLIFNIVNIVLNIKYYQDTYTTGSFGTLFGYSPGSLALGCVGSITAIIWSVLVLNARIKRVDHLDILDTTTEIDSGVSGYTAHPYLIATLSLLSWFIPDLSIVLGQRTYRFDSLNLMVSQANIKTLCGVQNLDTPIPLWQSSIRIHTAA